MMQFGQSLPRYGSLTAQDIYVAVGVALSWWESSEDQLSFLYRYLTIDEPDRIKIYIKATRNVRAQMLDKALRSGEEFFLDKELGKLREALDGLKKLVGRRNEISHGYCSQQTSHVNGVLTVSGHFLVPAMNEAGPMARPTDMHDAMTADDIAVFIKELRLHRGVVLDAAGIIMMRVQDKRDKSAGVDVIYGAGCDPWERTF